MRNAVAAAGWVGRRVDGHDHSALAVPASEGASIVTRRKEACGAASRRDGGPTLGEPASESWTGAWVDGWAWMGIEDGCERMSGQANAWGAEWADFLKERNALSCHACLRGAECGGQMRFAHGLMRIIRRFY